MHYENLYDFKVMNYNIGTIIVEVLMHNLFLNILLKMKKNLVVLI